MDCDGSRMRLCWLPELCEPTNWQRDKLNVGDLFWTGSVRHLPVCGCDDTCLASSIECPTHNC